MKRKILTAIFESVLILSIVLSGCTGLSNTKKAEAVVSGMFEAIKGTDIEKVKEYVISNESVDFSKNTSNEAGKFIYQHLDYRILSSHEENENTVIVNTEITALNMSQILSELMKLSLEQGSNVSEDDYSILLQQVLDSGNINSVNQTVDITVKNYSGTWKVNPDLSLQNAITGQSS